MRLLQVELLSLGSKSRDWWWRLDTRLLIEDVRDHLSFFIAHMGLELELVIKETMVKEVLLLLLLMGLIRESSSGINSGRVVDKTEGEETFNLRVQEHVDVAGLLVLPSKPLREVLKLPTCPEWLSQV